MQLAEEAAAIHRAFPELREGGVKAQGGRRGNRAAAENPFPGPRKRRKMSAAARKRIGDAQRTRWAKQKAGSAKKK